MQYLLRNGVAEISRDNFSFSTKIKVGDFYEAREAPEVNVAILGCCLFLICNLENKILL